MKYAYCLLLLLAMMSSPLIASDQHCGGPCEHPRSADPISANPRFQLSFVRDKKADGSLHFHWDWMVDGEAAVDLGRFLYKPPLTGFGYSRIFLSPAGNGFLVTGNPYTEQKFGYRLRPGSLQPPLFAFFDAKGEQLVDIPLRQVLTKVEQTPIECLNCKCCKNVLHGFAKDPTLSANGCFVDIEALETKRAISFFLPLGLLILDKPKFEGYLASAEWSRIPEGNRKAVRKVLAGAIEALQGNELWLHETAKKTLFAKGFLAYSALQEALSKAPLDEQSLLHDIAEQLRPFKSLGWQALTIDLGLLSSLLTYPDAAVAKTVLQRLALLIPDILDLDASAAVVWIEKHRDELRWNEDQHCYER